MKPEIIIEIINKHYNVDITIKSKKRTYSDLRCVYFYLAQKYCFNYSLDEIGEKVGKKHANVITMTKRFIERVDVLGYESLKEKLYVISNIIESDYKKDEDVVFDVKVQDYEFIQLKRRYKKSINTIQKINNNLRYVKKQLSDIKGLYIVC